MTQILSKDNTNGQISSRFFRNVRERMIEFALFLAALSSVGTTFGILYILVTESWYQILVPDSGTGMWYQNVVPNSVSRICS